MSRGWEELAARARGLSSRLLTPAALRDLAATASLDALAGALEAAGYGARPDGAISPVQVEEQLRSGAAARMRVLARWSAGHADALAPVFEDEDRRSIRALLRGAAALAPQAERLAGLVPTPALPSGALGELARQASVREVAALLAAWESPYGTALLEEARRHQPDLYVLECRLDATFAARARVAARRGGREMREHVRLLLDIANSWSALLAGALRTPERIAELWLRGGRRLTRERWDAVVAAAEPEARGMLAETWRGTPLEAALAVGATEPPEDAALATMLDAALRAARASPVSAAPAVLYALRLRRELRTLRRIAWGKALGAPATVLAGQAA